MSYSNKTATSCLSQDEPEQVIDVRIWNCGVHTSISLPGECRLMAVLNIVKQLPVRGTLNSV